MPQPGSVGALFMNLRNVGDVEILERTALGRAALVLIARSVDAGTVWVLGSRGHPEEAKLADFHPWPQGDREICDIAQLEGDVTHESWVNKASGCVSE